MVRGRILAIDYGSKNMGLACSDELRMTVRPLPSLRFTTRRLEWFLRLTIGSNLQLAIRGAIFIGIVLFIPKGIMQTVVDRYIRPKLVKK